MKVFSYLVTGSVLRPSQTGCINGSADAKMHRRQVPSIISTGYTD